MRPRSSRPAALVGLLVALAARPAHAVAKPLRVLLVGNSYTHMNDGLGVVLGKLAPESKVDRIAVCGSWLEQFASERKVKDALAAKGYDVVVLQEQSQTPVIATHASREGALALDRQIRAAGARAFLQRVAAESLGR